MRRIYVMDCGDFVKIGVSMNAEQRRKQIPYKVKQYYCTEPLKNPFKTERFLHHLLKSERKEDAKGTEYFKIGFSDACNILDMALNGKEKTYLEWIFNLECDFSEKIDLAKFTKSLLALDSEDLSILKFNAQVFKTSNLLKTAI